MEVKDAAKPECSKSDLAKVLHKKAAGFAVISPGGCTVFQFGQPQVRTQRGTLLHNFRPSTAPWHWLLCSLTESTSALPTRFDRAASRPLYVHSMPPRRWWCRRPPCTPRPTT